MAKKEVTPIAGRAGWGTVSAVAKDGDKEYPFTYEATMTWEAFKAWVANLTDESADEARKRHNYGLDLDKRADARPATAVETTVIKRSDGSTLDLVSLPLPVLCKVINGAMAQGVIGKKPQGAIVYTRKVLLEQHKVVEKDGEVTPASANATAPAKK